MIERLIETNEDKIANLQRINFQKANPQIGEERVMRYFKRVLDSKIVFFKNMRRPLGGK
jgi:hypothetical protein